MQTVGPQVILFDDEAFKALKVGVDWVGDAVTKTLGPGGNNAAIDQSYGPPTVTKDGVTVGRSINLVGNDPNAKLGADLLQSAAEKTNYEAGDGTTTVTALTHAMFTLGYRAITGGGSRAGISRGILKALDVILPFIKGTGIAPNGAPDWEKVYSVALISANGNEKIATLITDVMKKTSHKASFVIEEGRSANTIPTIVPGMQYDRGLMDAKFFNDIQKQRFVGQNCALLLVADPIEKGADFANLIPAFEQAHAKEKDRPPFVIICPRIEAWVVDELIHWRNKWLEKDIVQPVVLINAPGWDGEQNFEMLLDVAALTGATLVSARTQLPLKDATPECLGFATTVVSSLATTNIVGDATICAEAIAQRKKDIQAQIAAAPDHEYVETRLKERLAKLEGGIVNIKVGGATPIDIVTKKHLIEDAVNAVKGAIEDGVLPGGGLAYILLAHLLGNSAFYKESSLSEDERRGVSIVIEALRHPTFTIAKNNGFNGAMVVGKLTEPLTKKSWDSLADLIANTRYLKGFNATDDTYVPIEDYDVYDPVRVVQSAVINSLTMAAKLLSVGVTITRSYPSQAASLKN